MHLEFESQLGRLTPEDWYARIEEIAEEHGNFTPLGDNHFASFLDAGTKLLVTFENAEDIRKSSKGAEPRGFAYTRTEGWSHLAIISQTESWYRDPAIYRYFDRLIDDGFFEDFDKVLFHGTGGGGYAAAAYCVASPGCNVLALRPQATLDPRIAGWDTRYVKQRKHDFNDRYGFAPDMIDAANHAYIGFDPMQRFDATHAAIFTKRNVTSLRMNGLGGKLDLALDSIGVLSDLMVATMDNTLTDQMFNSAMRERRTNDAYIRTLYSRMMATDHPILAANVCAYVLRTRENEFFAKKLDELRGQGIEPSRDFKPFAA